MSVLHVRQLAPQEIRELRRRGVSLGRPPRRPRSEAVVSALLHALTARLTKAILGLLEAP
jgi:hypothetical protein